MSQGLKADLYQVVVLQSGEVGLERHHWRTSRCAQRGEVAVWVERQRKGACVLRPMQNVVLRLGLE